MIYTGWTSHCDIQPYTGWVIAYSADTLKQTGVLNLTPNGSRRSDLDERRGHGVGRHVDLFRSTQTAPSIRRSTPPACP